MIINKSRTLHLIFVLAEKTFCNITSFNCALEGPKCIPSSWVCDGQKDCSDGSDEGNEECGENFQFLSHGVTFYAIPIDIMISIFLIRVNLLKGVGKNIQRKRAS